MTSQWLEDIANNLELKGQDLRVLLVLIANIDYLNVDISQVEIGKKLKIKKQSVNKSIQKLQKLGLIEKRFLSGKLVGYTFVPDEQ